MAAAALLILPPNQYVAAKTYNDVEKFIDEFAANNIMFYNPLDCVGGKSGGNTVLPGNNTKEKNVELLYKATHPTHSTGNC